MQVFLLLRIAAAIAGGYLANKKGRDTMTWSLLCGFFPFMLIVIVFLPLKLSLGKTKKCPYCLKVLYRDALVCDHCNAHQAVNMVRCSSCGNYVPEKEYCMNCNRRVG